MYIIHECAHRGIIVICRISPEIKLIGPERVCACDRMRMYLRYYNGRNAHLRTVAKSKYHYMNYLGRDSFPISMVLKYVVYVRIYFMYDTHIHNCR